MINSYLIFKKLMMNLKKQHQITNPIEISNSNNSIYIETTTQEKINFISRLTI